MTTSTYPVKVERTAGYQAQPWVVVGEVAAGDTPLHNLGLLVAGLLRAQRRGVLFAILFTGRYPRGIFDFNVGVLEMELAGRLLRLRGSRDRPVSAFHTAKTSRTIRHTWRLTIRTASRMAWSW